MLAIIRKAGHRRLRRSACSGNRATYADRLTRSPAWSFSVSSSTSRFKTGSLAVAVPSRSGLEAASRSVHAAD